jgi:FMN phosphatase YigB (HAD superfamily)
MDMKIYYLPDNVQGLIFDIDLTLYNSRAYAQAQTELLIERAARELEKDYSVMSEAIQAYQREYAKAHEQLKPSLGNTFVALGIPIEQSIRWREELLKPEDYLVPDTKLQLTLKKLSTCFKILAVTNNPSLVGRRTLDVLGVASFFQTVIGLDTSGVSKPHKIPFLLAQKALDLPFHRLISIGDRYEIDLDIPLALGMGGILVENMDDVYGLPGVFKIDK